MVPWSWLVVSKMFPFPLPAIMQCGCVHDQLCTPTCVISLQNINFAIIGVPIVDGLDCLSAVWSKKANLPYLMGHLKLFIISWISKIYSGWLKPPADAWDQFFWLNTARKPHSLEACIGGSGQLAICGWCVSLLHNMSSGFLNMQDGYAYAHIQLLHNWNTYRCVGSSHVRWWLFLWVKVGNKLSRRPMTGYSASPLLELYIFQTTPVGWCGGLRLITHKRNLQKEEPTLLI